MFYAFGDPEQSSSTKIAGEAMALQVLEITVDILKPLGRSPADWLVKTSWKVIDARSRSQIESGGDQEEVVDRNLDKEALVARICGDVARQTGTKEAELTMLHLRSGYPTEAAAKRGEGRIQRLISERNPELTAYMAWGMG